MFSVQLSLCLVKVCPQGLDAYHYCFRILFLYEYFVFIICFFKPNFVIKVGLKLPNEQFVDIGKYLVASRKY